MKKIILGLLAITHSVLLSANAYANNRDLHFRQGCLDNLDCSKTAAQFEKLRNFHVVGVTSMSQIPIGELVAVIKYELEQSVFPERGHDGEECRGIGFWKVTINIHKKVSEASYPVVISKNGTTSSNYVGKFFKSEGRLSCENIDVFSEDKLDKKISKLERDLILALPPAGEN